MELTDLWIESLQAAYWLARYECSGETDESVLHPYSFVWGQIRALEGLEPVLAHEDVRTDAETMRDIARADAGCL